MSDQNHQNQVQMRHVKNGRIDLNVDPNSLPMVECRCGHTLFEQAVIMREVSQLHPQNPTGKSLRIPQMVHVCRACGEPLI